VICVWLLCRRVPLISFFQSSRYEELTKGTTNITDHDARNIAIENLQARFNLMLWFSHGTPTVSHFCFQFCFSQKMIRSWLDEMHPEMPLKERYLRAEMMDIALIEAKKEESMKSLYQLDSVIRMSLIEAQFLKKVRFATRLVIKLKVYSPIVV
jgi:hypothetical protein